MVPRVGLCLRAAPLLGAVLAVTFVAAQTGAKPGQDSAGHAGNRSGPVPAARVLLVVNDNSPLSREIGEYYARRRGVPPQNICRIKASISEEISRDDYLVRLQAALELKCRFD